MPSRGWSLIRDCRLSSLHTHSVGRRPVTAEGPEAEGQGHPPACIRLRFHLSQRVF